MNYPPPTKGGFDYRQQQKETPMQNKELQVRALFEKMLEDTQEYARTYEHYVKDMKNYSAKVQWKLGPISGYQVFKGPEYSFKTDAEIEDPDILIECDDLNPDYS